MNNSTGRLQRLPIEFWMPQNRSLYDKSFYINIWETDVQEGARPTKVETCKDALDCVHQIRKLNDEGVFAFASGPVPCFGNQHCVFAFTGAKEGAQFIRNKGKVFDLVRRAYNCLFNLADNIQKVGRPKTEPTCPKKNTVLIDKDDPKSIVIKVKYSEDDAETYSFRCRVWHMANDFVCVHSRNKYVNVKVTACEIMSESEIKAFASLIGYADIKEVYCDTAIDTVEAWVNWTKTEEAEEEYQEDMTELQAMKEAFSPACDYVSHEPENIYDGENFDVCEDEDELPE